MQDDAHGSIEVVVFPEAFKQWGHLAENGRMVVVTGKVERDDETARILASELAPIETVSERLATSVAITVTSPPHDRVTVEKLWDVLSHHKGDRAVALTIETRPPLKPMRVKVDVHSQIRVRPSEQLVADVERVCGQGSVTLWKTTRVRL
jgi:DNA polymerase-3 subunit alpha